MNRIRPSPPMHGVLRPNIDRRQTGRHIERHGGMLLREHPGVLDLAIAGGHTPTHLDFRTVQLRCLDLVESVAERDIVARGDCNVQNVVPDRALLK